MQFSLHLLRDSILAILPEGTVRDEGAFLIMIVILFGMIGLAIYLRRRRNAQPDDNEDEEE